MSNTLKYRGYHGQIEFSAEDNLFIGHVIGIQDSLNFHGSSIDEITSSFHDCIDGYLEMCKTFGREPDKEYKGSFNVRISPQLHRSAAVQAEAAGKSLNQFIQEAIEEKLSPDSKPVVIMIDRQGTLVPTSDPSFPADTQRRYQPSVSLS